MDFGTSGAHSKDRVTTHIAGREAVPHFSLPSTCATPSKAPKQPARSSMKYSASGCHPALRISLSFPPSSVPAGTATKVLNGAKAVVKRTGLPQWGQKERWRGVPDFVVVST